MYFTLLLVNKGIWWFKDIIFKFAYVVLEVSVYVPIDYG